MVLRKDLPLGMQIAQTIHAAGESAAGIALPSNTHAVALHVRSELELRAVAARLAAAGVRHSLIVEADAPYEGQAMAFGVHPHAGEEARRLLGSLPLAK